MITDGRMAMKAIPFRSLALFVPLAKDADALLFAFCYEHNPGRLYRNLLHVRVIFPTQFLHWLPRNDTLTLMIFLPMQALQG